MNALHDQKGTPDLKQGMSRSLVRFLTITVVSVIAVGGTWGSAVWEYRSWVNQFRKRGDPTTIEEVVTSYTVPVGIADSTEQWSKVQEVLESADLASSGEGVPLLCRDLSNYRFPEPGQPCEFLEISEQFLRRIDPVIQAVREASAIRGQARLPTEIHPLENVLVIQSNFLRNARRVLEIDAFVAGHRHDSDRVFLDIQNLLALTEAVANAPGFVTQVEKLEHFDCAFRILEGLAGHCRWSDAQWEELDRQLRSIRFETGMRSALIALSAEAICLSHPTAWRPFQLFNINRLLRTTDQNLQLLANPWPEPFRSPWIKLSKKGQNAVADTSDLSETMRPVVESAIINVAESEAKRRMLLLLVASHRFARKHGQWPADLDDVMEAWTAGDPEIAVDPFSGKSLLHRKIDSGWRVYSRGKNATDDGGDRIADLTMRLWFSPVSARENE